MKTTLAYLTVTLLLGCGICRAAEPAGNWSARVSSGLGITVSPADNAGNFPYSTTVSGDVIYMLNDLIGVVPLSINYNRFSFDRYHFAYTAGIPGSALDEVDGAAWMLSYTPGIYLAFPLTGKVREYVQIGAGINHFESSAAAPSASSHMTDNRFGLNLACGFEFPVSAGTAVVAGIEYLMVGKPDWGYWYFDKDKSTKYYHIRLGAKLDLF